MGGGSECTALSPPSIVTTEVPLSKAPNHQLLPRRRSINGCPLLRVWVHGVCVFTAVCVHLGWVKCRAQIPRMRLHTWLHLTPQNFSTSRFWTIISVTRSRDISVLCGHENVSLAHIFETERLFPSAVIEAHAHEDLKC